MSEYNLFEKTTDKLIDKEAIEEASIGSTVNKFQKVLNNIAPDSKLFDGPGFAGKDYKTDKRYFPNIRKGGKAFFKNVTLDQARQDVYNAINDPTYKVGELANLRSYTDVLDDPRAEVPEKLQKYVSPMFSSDYIAHSIDKVEGELNEFIKILSNTQGLQPKEGDELHDLLNAIKVFKEGDHGGKQSMSRASSNAVITDAQLYRQALTDSNSVYMKSLSLLQKSYLGKVANNLEKFMIAWKVMFQDSTHRPESIISDSPTNGDFLNDEGLIYRNLWGVFIDNIQDSMVGSGQGGWERGPTTYNIIIGREFSKYIGRGGLEYKKRVTTVPPTLVKKFHENTMIDLFLNTEILLYATTEQWESYRQGSKFIKGFSGVAKGMVDTGKSAPKVSL